MTEMAESWSAEHEKTPKDKKYSHLNDKMLPLMDAAASIGKDAKPVLFAIYNKTTGGTANMAGMKLKQLGEDVAYKT